MTAVNGKIFLLLSLLVGLAWCQQVLQDFDENEVPDVLSYNSPLKHPDSLRSRPYFDFLSTLYKYDADKSQLFSPYIRTRREAVNHERSKRAIVFRPLFVYRQQTIRKQNLHRRRI